MAELAQRRQERIDKILRDKKKADRLALIGGEERTREEILDDPMNMQMHTVLSGVTLTWLHYVFKRDRNTAKILLRDCPVIRMGKGGAPIYDVAEAAQYLVKPKMNIAKLIGTLKEGDLPDDLKPKVWEAKLKRQRWEERAGQLWRADDLADQTTLTEPQRKIITERIDGLQADLHQALIELAAERRTPSQLSEEEPEEP